MPFAKRCAERLKRALKFRKSAATETAPQQDHHHLSDDAGDPYAGLSEVAASPPVQNRDEEAQTYVHHTLEQERERE